MFILLRLQMWIIAKPIIVSKATKTRKTTLTNALQHPATRPQKGKTSSETKTSMWIHSHS